MNRLLTATLAATLLSAAPATMACSSCGCTLGTEWADQNYRVARGLSAELRYDFVDQDQLRRGPDAVDRAAVPLPNDDEIQNRTLTRFLTLGLDYAFNRDWGLNLQLPYISRYHDTYAPGDDRLSTSTLDGLGDLRLVGRYQGFFDDRSTGVQFGLKLPTGRTQQRFDARAGDDDAPEIVDRGLQDGTGTTDLILGAYHYAALNRDFDHFEQVQAKLPLDSDDQFRPSTQISGNFGLRWLARDWLIPQAQVNVKWENREKGANADTENSGSTAVYLSPGLTVKPARALAVFGFVQLPVYQYDTGYQLAPRWLLSVGLRYAW